MNNRRTQQSIDGFALRRRPQQTINPNRLGVDHPTVPNRFLRPGAPAVPSREAPGRNLPTPQLTPGQSSAAPTAPAPQPVHKDTPRLSRSEIDASLAALDEPTVSKKAAKHRWRPSKKFVKRALLILLLLIVIGGAYIGIKAFLASSRIFQGNLFDLLGSGQELKTDEYGRSNILVFGTSEDDGPDHGGAHLTDSIMIVSIDQKNKNAGMVSVPRDLWVEYGTGCNAGFQGKINEIYTCYSDEGTDEKKGAEALMRNVGENFGMDIQYYAHVNYGVVRQSVDAVGGVDVVIESVDPRGILDRNFDWDCPNGKNTCYNVKYPNGPAHLNGKQALYLARARGAGPPGTIAGQTYGLPQANFDREKNQQKILTALKVKATSAGTLSNPLAVTNLIDSMGDNVRTNFNGGEIKTLINLGKDIPTEKIKSISLVEPGNSVVTTGMVSGQSVVIPAAGNGDFSEIQSYLRQKLSNANGESAVIDVLNGSDSMGVASAKAKELKQANLTVGKVGDVPTNNYDPIQWYDLSKGKQAKTATKLKEVLGVPASGTTLPTGVQSSADFVIIIGNGAD